MVFILRTAQNQRTHYLKISLFNLAKLQISTTVSSINLEVFRGNSRSETVMDMKKKITCAVLIAAASMSAVAAADESLVGGPAVAPSPHSGSAIAMPVIGSLIGASLMSFFAVYLH